MDQEKLKRWQQLCQEIHVYGDESPPGAIVRYAGAYANAGRNMLDPDDISTQAIYIKSNLSHVHSPKGKDFKNRLKEFF